MSRAEISREVGLSRPTVSSLIDLLIAAGIASEDKTTSVRSGRTGRPGTNVQINVRRFGLIGIEIGARFLQLISTNLRGDVLVAQRKRINLRTDPSSTIDTLVTCIEDALQKLQRMGMTSLGIGLGVPSPITADHPGSLQPKLYPEWSGISLTDALTEKFDHPIFVENDANLGAVGVQVWRDTSTSHLVYLKLDAGVGAGILNHGKLLRGVDGLAGEIGHFQVKKDGPECYCGKRGCLVQYLGTESMMRTIRERLEHFDDEAVTAAIDAPHSLSPEFQDEITREVLPRVVEPLSIAVSALTQLINPELVVFGGPGAALPGLPDQLNAILSAQSQDGTPFRVQFETPNEFTTALGACALVMKRQTSEPMFGLSVETGLRVG